MRATEARRLQLIARACDEYQFDTHCAFEGAEKAVPGGHEGTAPVGEFLCVELGALLGCSPVNAACRIAEALDVRDRHPQLWEAVADGRVHAWQAVRLAGDCSHLSAEAAGWVDRQVGIALKVWPFQRVRRQIPKWIIQADPALAEKRVAEAKARRGVEIVEHADGCSVL